MLQEDFFRDMQELAKYFCKQVRENCEVTDDLEHLMVSVVAMAMVVEKLRGIKAAKHIQKRLHDECCRIVAI